MIVEVGICFILFTLGVAVGVFTDSDPLTISVRICLIILTAVSLMSLTLGVALGAFAEAKGWRLKELAHVAGLFIAGLVPSRSGMSDALSLQVTMLSLGFLAVITNQLLEKLNGWWSSWPLAVEVAIPFVMLGAREVAEMNFPGSTYYIARYATVSASLTPGVLLGAYVQTKLRSFTKGRRAQLSVFLYVAAVCIAAGSPLGLIRCPPLAGCVSIASLGFIATITNAHSLSRSSKKLLLTMMREKGHH